MRLSASIFAAVAVAFMAMALPTEDQTVDFAERDFVVRAGDLSGHSSSDELLNRAASDETAIEILERGDSDEVAPNTEMAVRQIPYSNHKNLFTITLKGSHVVVNGAINFAIQAYIESINNVHIFRINALTGGTYRATATLLSYEFKKNWFGTAFNRVSAEIAFTWVSASETVYKFIGNVVYGIDSRVTLLLEDVQLFEILSGTQQLAKQAATNLVLGSYDDDYGEL
ncbi:hypothetical protein CORC01_04609 [Colletotrichum orchidophilum]|uniref:Uncharacterized protein n=1 Tax=Colletotrichum orchidophilum TaxID=1209926 RepID=A0A1G4BFQ5_9PEZI|nr:uncharacterized protein CORC01_04609 [Colletotrichum orchidophilum]OHF00201.1 hypothetical protein CORC01_04609 [Colletotrichum orchidophilum]